MAQNPPPTPPPFPSPEELKSKITEFMKQNFGDRVSVATITEPDPAVAEEDEKPAETEHEEFEFHLLPRDIKAQLDRFVIKQEEAKKVLAIAVCDHYNHANYLRRLEKDDPNRAQEIEYMKQNVILVGPTGVGKTYLIKHIADLIKVPFVKADATKFSETGCVGWKFDRARRQRARRADHATEADGRNRSAGAQHERYPGAIASGVRISAARQSQTRYDQHQAHSVRRQRRV